GAAWAGPAPSLAAAVGSGDRDWGAGRGRGPAAAAGGVLPYGGGTACGTRPGLRLRSSGPCGGNPEPSRAGADRVGRVRAATRGGGPAAVCDWRTRRGRS